MLARAVCGALCRTGVLLQYAARPIHPSCIVPDGDVFAAVLCCVWCIMQDRRAFLQYAAKGCMRFDLNRPAWALESEVRQLGGLIYW